MRHETFTLNGNPKTTLTTYLPESYGLKEYRPLVIVCPGGGFLDCSPNEGECVALHFVRAGYNAAVLVYSNKTSAPDISAMPQSLFDMAEAICLVRSHYKEWGVDADKIAILGFSAGAQLCALYGNRWNSELFAQYGSPELRKPNAVILGYPPLENEKGDVTETEINMQSVLGGNDRAVQIQ